MTRWSWLWLLGALFTNSLWAQSLPLRLTQGELRVAVHHNGGLPDSVHELGLQQLPWKWDEHFLSQHGVMQFRLEVAVSEALFQQIKAQGKGLALSSLKLGNRYRFRLNSGNWTTVGWDEATTQLRVMPRWHLLAVDELTMGRNLLELEMKAEPAVNSGLATLEIGDAETSLGAHMRLVTTRYATALAVGTLSLLICCMSLGMGWSTRENFFWISAAAEAAFVISQFDWLIDYPPAPTWVFNAIRSVLFAYYAGLMCWLGILLIAAQARWLNRAIYIYLCLALPVLAIGAAIGDVRVYQVFWNGATLMLGGICVARLTYFSWRERNFSAYIYAAGGWVALSFGAYDFVLDQMPSSLGVMRLGDYSFLIFNLGLGAVIVRRYLAAQQELGQVRASIQLQSEQATYRERQRMMQDIHDSVGSQLVALLGLVNSNAPRAQIQSHTSEALDELRIAVDAISNVDGELAVVLATLRHRLQPRLDAASIRLVWKVDALPKFQRLTHQHIQHIQRILLEVFSNIIQHANATQVVLSARYDIQAKVCRIRISDNGAGFDASATTGRGLINIQRRANMLGATLSITQNEPSGTAVNLGIAVH
jgi:signal transduction histidine kinase